MYLFKIKISVEIYYFFTQWYRKQVNICFTKLCHCSKSGHYGCEMFHSQHCTVFNNRNFATNTSWFNWVDVARRGAQVVSLCKSVYTFEYWDGSLKSFEIFVYLSILNFTNGMLKSAHRVTFVTNHGARY